MPLLRILALALILWIIFRLIKRVIGPAKSERNKPIDYEEMVTCKHCKLHLPRGEAIVESGHSYCCKEHANADQRSE